MKKLVSSLLLVGTLFMFTGCSENKEPDTPQTPPTTAADDVQTTFEHEPQEVLNKMYEGFAEDELPMLMNSELTDDTLEYMLGLTELDYIDGMVSEPMIGSIAHSVVVVRVNEGVDVAQTVADIKANVNPRKWVCVEAEAVLVESKGNTIVLVMSNNDTATRLMENFKNMN